MRNVLFCAAAAAALGICPLASAAQPDRDGARSVAVAPGHGLRQQLEDLEGRIHRGIEQGQIDRGEADRAFGELNSIRREEDALRARGGGRLQDDDRLRLQDRLDHLSRSIHWMRENGGPGSGPNAGDLPPMGSGGHGPWSIDQRLDWLSDRIARGQRDGSLTYREAGRASEAMRTLRAREAQLMRRHGGVLTSADVAYLQSRLDQVSHGLRWARQNQEREPWSR